MSSSPRAGVAARAAPSLPPPPSARGSVALPANGHRSVMERLAPSIVDRLLAHPSPSSSEEEEEGGGGEAAGGGAMHVIISSHASLGAVYLMGLLREECRRRVKRRGRGDDRDRDDEREVDGIMGGGEDHGVGDDRRHGEEDVRDVRAGAHGEGISGRVHGAVLPARKVGR